MDNKIENIMNINCECCIENRIETSCEYCEHCICTDCGIYCDACNIKCCPVCVTTHNSINYKYNLCEDCFENCQE